MMTGAIIPLQLKRDEASVLAGFDALAAELLVEGRAPNLSVARLDAIVIKLRGQRTELAAILVDLEGRAPSCDERIDAVNADLGLALRPGSVDMLIFNPPYVPSEHVPSQPSDGAEVSTSSHDRFGQNASLLALTTDGGTDGMEVTNRLLAQLPNVLSNNGVAYVLLCAQNKPEIVKQGIRNWVGGWNVETVRTSGKQGGWERLQIIRISRMQQ